MSETQTRGQLLNAAIGAIDPSDRAGTLKSLTRYTRRISKATAVPDPDNPGSKKILDKELIPPEFIQVIDDDTFDKFHDKLKSCAGNPTKFKEVFCLGDGDTEAAPEAAPTPEALPKAPAPKAPAKKKEPVEADAGLLVALEEFVQSCAPSAKGTPDGLEGRVKELETVRSNTKTFLLNLRTRLEGLEETVKTQQAEIVALKGGEPTPAQPVTTEADGL